jgi:hypothetical protein
MRSGATHRLTNYVRRLCLFSYHCFTEEEKSLKLTREIFGFQMSF